MSEGISVERAFSGKGKLVLSASGREIHLGAWALRPCARWFSVSCVAEIYALRPEPLTRRRSPSLQGLWLRSLYRGMGLRLRIHAAPSRACFGGR